MPRVSATSRSRTRSSSGPASTESSSTRASASRKPPDRQLRQSRQLGVRNAGREDQTDRLRRQAARHEPQDLRGGAIKPLLVIHQADQRLLLGRVGQQAQHGQTDQKAIRRRPGTQAERGPQRITLRNRQTIDVIQHRRAQLLQPGERQLHLRLDTRSTRDTAARRSPGRILQQRRLTYARLTAHHQRPALTSADSTDQPVKYVALAAPARQPSRTSSDAGNISPSARRQHDTPANLTPLRRDRLRLPCPAMQAAV